MNPGTRAPVDRGPRPRAHYACTVPAPPEPERLIAAPPGSGAAIFAHAAGAGFGLGVTGAGAGAEPGDVRVLALDPFSPDLDAIPAGAVLLLRNPAHWVTALERRGLLRDAGASERALAAWRRLATHWIRIHADAEPRQPVPICFDELRLEPMRALAPAWSRWGLEPTPQALDRAIRYRERWYHADLSRRTRWARTDRPRSERRLRGTSWASIAAIFAEPEYAALAERFEWPTDPRRYQVRH